MENIFTEDLKTRKETVVCVNNIMKNTKQLTKKGLELPLLSLAGATTDSTEVQTNLLYDHWYYSTLLMASY